MTFSDRALIEAQNIAATLIRSDRMRHKMKEIDPKTLDAPSPLSDEHISRDQQVSKRYPEPAQETDSERAYRYQQIEYERGPAFEKNKALANSINTWSGYNFTNKILAAACDFTEMADHHPRSIFIQNFGPLIEEELKASHTRPSGRLAAFTTTYFWKEANWSRLIAAVPPETTKGELVEFFALPLHSDPGKRMIDALPNRITASIIHAAQDKEVKLDFKKEKTYLSLQESEELIASCKKLAQQNFTNRILTSTSYFSVSLSNPFNNGRQVQDFGRNLMQDLKTNPDKPSPTLVTLMTEKPFSDEDIKILITGVTPKTTKTELTEFFGARENWSTNLRMIDYLNHHTVMEMGRFLPESDKLDLWSLKPEMVYDFNVGDSLRKLSQKSQEIILDTVQDPTQKKQIQEKIKKQCRFLHVSIGLMGGGNINTDTLDILGNFEMIRKRRICSHADNRHFFSGLDKSHTY